MRRLSLTVLLAMCVSAAAHADSFPTYNMTQGTVALTNSNINSFDISWSFSNGSGATLQGWDTWGTCLQFAPGGSACNPLLMVGLNQNGASLNGSAVDFNGGLTITAANFLLPTTGATFGITLPVLFQGTFSTCPYSPLWGISYGCTSSNINGIFNVNGAGSVTINFSSFNTGNGLVWTFTGATYTLNSTPEPASFVLLGTGALAIFGKLRGRKRQLRNRLTS